MGSDLRGDRNYERFGSSVSLSTDGTTLAVGAGTGVDGGRVRGYRWNGEEWAQVGQTFSPSGESGDYGTRRVALSDDGRTLAIGHPGGGSLAPNNGEVQVYALDDNDNWNPLGQVLEGPAKTNVNLGDSVSLSGDGRVLAAAAPRYFDDDGVILLGLIQVWQLVGNEWVPVGNPITGERLDKLGQSLSLSSDANTLVAGAPGYEDASGISRGRIFVYTLEDGDWVQKGRTLDAASEFSDPLDFGASVTIAADGNMIAAAGTLGCAIFYFDNGDWQLLIRWDDATNKAVNLSPAGTMVALGYPNANGISGTGSGSTFLFNRLSFEVNGWTHVGTAIDGVAAFDSAGSSLSLSGDGTVIAVPAASNGLGGLAAGHVQVYTLEDRTCLSGTVGPVETPAATPSSTSAPTPAPSPAPSDGAEAIDMDGPVETPAPTPSSTSAPTPDQIPAPSDRADSNDTDGPVETPAPIPSSTSTPTPTQSPAPSDQAEANDTDDSSSMMRSFTAVSAFCLMVTIILF